LNDENGVIIFYLRRVFCSTLVTSGMANLCKGVSLPPMTVPFNLIDLLMFICLPSSLTHLATFATADNATTLELAASINDSVLNLNGTLLVDSTVSLDWIMVRERQEFQSII
jgi:hypothetical protein